MTAKWLQEAAEAAYPDVRKGPMNSGYSRAAERAAFIAGAELTAEKAVAAFEREMGARHWSTLTEDVEVAKAAAIRSLA